MLVLVQKEEFILDLNKRNLDDHGFLLTLVGERLCVYICTDLEMTMFANEDDHAFQHLVEVFDFRESLTIHLSDLLWYLDDYCAFV